ncbi:MAG: hypothetical protein J3Q66DRAFT_174285 [Benniella sp.]|nr:MAG: hypothetical protein J3Q66DRAFT_174285 [Benniella sp.]
MMLSLIRPSPSPCLHLPEAALSVSDTSLNDSVPAKILLSTESKQSTPSYKDHVAHFTAKSPQPYGIIPPRKKRLPKVSTALSLKKTAASCPTSPIESSTNALELKPTSSSSSSSSSSSLSRDASSSDIPIRKQLFQSLQLFLPESSSSSSSSRLGFWANLKAHYLSPAVTTLSWSDSSSSSSSNSTRTAASTATTKTDSFSPPSALRLSNSTPVAAIDAATQLSASLILTDDLQSLPNVASSFHAHHGSVNFPVSVAAMDKFKPNRSDTIPLKTFTYSETPVIERPSPLPLPISPRLTPSRPDYSKHQRSKSSSATILPAKKDAKEDITFLPTLPRHLAMRETRSNTDYLRMMAAELRMIRSRKLVSPLKPRGYLPRRKDPFRRGMHVSVLSVQQSRYRYQIQWHHHQLQQQKTTTTARPYPPPFLVRHRVPRIHPLLSSLFLSLPVFSFLPPRPPRARARSFPRSNLRYGARQKKKKKRLPKGTFFFACFAC